MKIRFWQWVGPLEKPQSGWNRLGGGGWASLFERSRSLEEEEDKQQEEVERRGRLPQWNGTHYKNLLLVVGRATPTRKTTAGTGLVAEESRTRTRIHPKAALQWNPVSDYNSPQQLQVSGLNFRTSARHDPSSILAKPV